MALILDDDYRFDRFTAAGIWRRNDGDFPNIRMLVEHGFHFCGPDLESRRIDHALQPVGDVVIPIFVAATEISGAHEFLPLQFNEHRLVGLGPLPVSQHDLRSMYDNFALFVWSKHGECLRVDDARFGVEGWK